jgi:hypothetical protein
MHQLATLPSKHAYSEGFADQIVAISRTMAVERRAQVEQSYFRHLPFAPAEIVCLSLPEILSEKIRIKYSVL